LDDLAALSGVSRSTVSRVINGGSTSERARRQVMAALAETGFRPNVAARMLASGRSGVMGVVTHLSPSLLFQDPYFGRLLQGIADALAERSLGMMLWLGNRSREENLDRILSMRLLDGAIVTANELDDPLVDGMLASTLPTVLVGHRSDDVTASYVSIDDVAAAEHVVSHIASIGRTRIGHISGTRGTIAAEDRIEGYRRALERAGLDPRGFVVDGDFNEPSGALAAATLLDMRVDAIFCANDATALGALRTIHERGLRVPEDVAVAGFDDLGFAAQADPPLTTVRQGIQTQGTYAVRALFDLLAHPDGGPRRIVLPTELVIRRSTVGGASDADLSPTATGAADT
jgi:DNA-binding LacI/PurR family transcriptional regulator